MEFINALGRRKTSVARVYLAKGDGTITINGRKFDEYFTTPVLRQVAARSLEVTNSIGQFTIKANLEGGGITGQAGALSLGIARALMQLDANNHDALKAADLLTRDPRMVERKKPGQKKARKRFQFSKR